jgi:D-allose transport system substrate-binding protein
MKDGYEFAGEEYGVDIEVGSVPTEADTAAQLALLESWLTMGIDALCVSPITPNNLNPALAQASEMGIPIINVDELIPEEAAKEAGIDIATRIASNNYYAGVLAGKYMIDHLDAGSKVAVIEGMAGNVSGMSRRDGFLDTVKDVMDVVAEQPGNWEHPAGESGAGGRVLCKRHDGPGCSRGDCRSGSGRRDHPDRHGRHS